MEFTEREMSMANSVAYKCAKDKQQREEIQSFLYLWMAENYSTIQRYRSVEGGENKLFTALRNSYYNENLRMKRLQYPELFEYSYAENKELCQKIKADIIANHVTHAVSYVLRHKYQKALLAYFLGKSSLYKVADEYGIGKQSLQRAKRNTMLIARENDGQRYL